MTKLEKKCIKQMAKFLAKKMEGKHPSKREMIKFTRKYKSLLAYEVIREPSDNAFEEGSSFGYFQYILLVLRCAGSGSAIHISCLPWREITQELEIPAGYPKTCWVDEGCLFPSEQEIEEELEIEEEVPI